MLYSAALPNWHSGKLNLDASRSESNTYKGVSGRGWGKIGRGQTYILTASPASCPVVVKRAYHVNRICCKDGDKRHPSTVLAANSNTTVSLLRR